MQCTAEGSHQRMGRQVSVRIERLAAHRIKLMDVMPIVPKRSRYDGEFPCTSEV